MKLLAPFHISSHLTPALQIGKAEVRVEFDEYTSDGRCGFKWGITLPNGTIFEGDDLNSGVGREYNPALLQEMFESLLTFLSSAGDAYRTRSDDSDDEDLIFPLEVCEWAHGESDEISMMALDLEENAGLYLLDDHGENLCAWSAHSNPD